jgi:hypothetical protein
MAIKHTEFMKLTQGDKSVTEYLYVLLAYQDMLLNSLIRMPKRLLVSKGGFVPIDEGYVY